MSSSAALHESYQCRHKVSPLDGGRSDGQGRAALHHNSPSCLVRLLSEGGQGAAKHFDPVMTSIMSVPEESEKRENN